MKDMDTLARELREQRQMLIWLIDETVAVQIQLSLIADKLRDVHRTVNEFTARKRAKTNKESHVKLLELAYERAAKRAEKLGLDDLKQYL